MPVTRKRIFKSAAKKEAAAGSDKDIASNSTSVVIDLQLAPAEDQAQEPETNQGVSTEVSMETQDEMTVADDDGVADDKDSANTDAAAAGDEENTEEAAAGEEETADVEMEQAEDAADANIEVQNKEVAAEKGDQAEADQKPEEPVKSEEKPVKSEDSPEPVQQEKEAETAAEKMEDDDEPVVAGSEKETRFPFPESINKLRQLTVNIGPIKQRDLLSPELHDVLNLSWNCEIKFEYKEGVQKAERPGFVKIPFVVTTPGMLVNIARTLGNLHINGRDMSVKFPDVFNTAVEDCKVYLEKRAELNRRQVILQRFPKDVKEATIKALFPEAKVTMNTAVALDGSAYVKSIRLQFETEQATTDFLASNKDVKIGDNKIAMSRVKEPLNAEKKKPVVKHTKKTSNASTQKAELMKRQIIVHNVPKDVQEGTIRSMFPQAAGVTLNMKVGGTGPDDQTTYVKSARLTFNTEKGAIDFLQQQSKKDLDIGGCKIRLMRVVSNEPHPVSGAKGTPGNTPTGAAEDKGKIKTFFGKDQGKASSGQFVNRPTVQRGQRKGPGQFGLKSGRGALTAGQKARGGWGQKQGGGQANWGAGGRGRAMQSPRGQGQGRPSMSPQGRGGGRQRNQGQGQGQQWQNRPYQEQQQMSPQRQANQPFAGQQASNRRQSGGGDDNPMEMMAYLKNTLARMEDKLSMQSGGGGGGGADYGYGDDMGMNMDMGMQKQKKRKRKAPQGQMEYGVKRQFNTSYNDGFDDLDYEDNQPQQGSYSGRSMGSQGYRNMVGQGQKITSVQSQRNMRSPGQRNISSMSQGNMGSSSMGNMGSSSMGNMGSSSMGNMGSSSMGNMSSSSMGNMGSSSMGNMGSSSMGNMGSSSMGNMGSSSMGNMGSSSMGNMGGLSQGNYSSMSQKSMGAQRSPRTNSTGQMGMGIGVVGQMSYSSQQGTMSGQSQRSMGGQGLGNTFVPQSSMGGQMGYSNSGNMW